MYRSPEADADLSISELSIQDAPSGSSSNASAVRPFSLLGRPASAEKHDVATKNQQEPLHEEDELENVEPETQNDQDDEVKMLTPEEAQADAVKDAEKLEKSNATSKEERLQHDLFVLQKLNAAFSLYNDALRDTDSGTERVGEQLIRTNALLDKYINILSKSEATARLIFDERWEGASADEGIIHKEQQAEQERIRRQEAERKLALEKEREAQEREKRLQTEKEERERLEAEKREKLATRAGYGGVRGVRGSTRGKGNSSRGAASSTSNATRGRISKVSPAPSAIPTSRIGRPASSASVKSSRSNRSSFDNISPS